MQTCQELYLIRYLHTFYLKTQVTEDYFGSRLHLEEKETGQVDWSYSVPSTHTLNRREPLAHEWSESLNEQEHSLVLPSNRETGSLSDTRIKMDALYFCPCSVSVHGGKEGE